jgi:hypothetical protein
LKSLVFFVLVSGLVVGCSKAPLAPDGASTSAAVSSSASGVAAAAGDAVQIATADVIDVSKGGIVAGTARLIRNLNGISVEVGTSGLVPNEVYTLWWVIYPVGCTDPLGCLVTNASGAVTDSQGRAHFGAHLSTGPLPPADGSVTLAGGDFTDPFGSEIVLVIHHHGPKVPGIVGRMLKTFDTGCAGTCSDDPQFVDFPPVR